MDTRTTIFILGALVISLGMFGTIYGVSLSDVNPTLKADVTKKFNTIFIVTSILMALLLVLALYNINSNDSVVV